MQDVDARRRLPILEIIFSKPASNRRPKEAWPPKDAWKFSTRPGGVEGVSAIALPGNIGAVRRVDPIDLYSFR
jgi:hypothetical protein